MTQDIWLIDQMAKSQYFHAKLHEWALPELADALANARGEDLDWDLSLLGIAEHAWNRVIHRGIKPILVFAHPAILSSIPRSCGYYRMLSMVSQKSMGHVKVVAGDFAEYEVGRRTLSPEQALPVARHLNEIISQLVSADATIDAHEFDLWRAMAAGTQAQGSWQNVKGRKAEAAIKGLLYLRLGERKLIAGEVGTNLSLPALIQLTDGRVVRFADDPDVGIYQGDVIVAAMEVKVGIDTAAVH
ncbi:MAG: XcyI family restriction endonuclease [Chloroflexota bacterium]